MCSICRSPGHCRPWPAAEAGARSATVADGPRVFLGGATEGSTQAPGRRGCVYSPGSDRFEPSPCRRAPPPSAPAPPPSRPFPPPPPPPLRPAPTPTRAPPGRAGDAPMSEFPAQRGTPGWLLPGALVLRLMLVTALALALSGALATWLVTQALEREAVRQLVSQQTDEVEVVARLLASKIEQSQKLLRTVAEGITPGMLKSPSALEWLLQQGLPAAQFFDTMQVAHASGQVRLSLRAGHLEQAADLDPAERDALRRTLVGGKPLVCELIAGGRPNEERGMLTMPLHHTNGSVLGVVAGALRLQSQSLLPPSMAWPTRDNSEFIVFTRDGTILSHSDPRRILGQVRDEAGLAPVYARWLAQAQPVVGRGITDVQPDYIASMAGMPLPQWIVARGVQTHPH